MLDDQICSILKAKPYARPIDIANQLGRKRAQVQNILGRLLDNNILIRDKKGYYVKDQKRANMIRSLICEGRWV